MRARQPHPYPHPKTAPLNSVWFATSIVGFIVSVTYITTISLSWGVAFAIVFAMMFGAGLLSMRRATPDEQLMPMPKRIK